MFVTNNIVHRLNNTTKQIQFLIVKINCTFAPDFGTY
ncbi:hypothetical protein DEU42_113129 [Flavobacterium sp. AG291]|nr:hypothetical protein DEU42_113129 [Flavobacterium sp. AG291]